MGYETIHNPVEPIDTALLELAVIFESFHSTTQHTHKQLFIVKSKKEKKKGKGSGTKRRDTQLVCICTFI